MNGTARKYCHKGFALNIPLQRQLKARLAQNYCVPGLSLGRGITDVTAHQWCRPTEIMFFEDNGLLVKYTLRLHRCSIGSPHGHASLGGSAAKESLPTLALPPGTMEFLRYGRADHDTTCGR